MVDPVTQEVIRNALIAGAEEMNTSIWRTARSTVVRETLDYSTALFDGDGTGALYWWTIAYISGIGTIAGAYIRRHPRLIKPSDRDYWALLSTTRARFRGWVFFLGFILAGFASLAYPFLGFYALLVLLPLDFLLQPNRAQRRALEDASRLARPDPD